MPLSGKTIVRTALTGILLAAVLLLTLSRDFYSSSMVSAYLSLALASALIVLATLRRSWLDLLYVLAGGLFLRFLDYRLLHFKPEFMAGFSFIGLAALFILGAHTIWACGERQKFLLYGFVPSVLFVASEWVASDLLTLTEKLHPKTFDLFLYSFDCSLHIQPSFFLGQIFFVLPWLRTFCLIIYIALPLPLALVYAAQLRRKKEAALPVMLAFLATGPLGVLCYNLLPACGPVHLFGAGFPWHPLSTAAVMRMDLVPAIMPGARNAIPSLHMSWVLLVWWNSKSLSRWIRTIALGFVVFTAMATLGIGEHYLIDLVVAFPFSLLVQALCSYSVSFRSPQRRTAFLFGTFATLAWLALLGFVPKLFWISPVLPWSLSIFTVAESVLLWAKLLNTAVQQQPADTRIMAVAAGN